ncbi:hypothetical protein [Cryobacterium psychrophilum]|uniref:Histidine kinase n=1 Tax=Cryobacterium psychrophilum TaxID=41988 RepID=A0A4Y8KLJ2_9MICO|nr:hypothetical protein [Cryobacterium psychrophilum]TDW30670.1 hypothetical protein EDD25_2439 [Cryobacterium psychrophilum]TFD77087.1 hypothetical protein E3T53_12540 [Cryobacterium psychrophilum]
MMSHSRPLILGLAALFSGYHILLGIYSINVPRSAAPIIAAMMLYGVASIASLWPTSPTRMSLGLALFNVAVCGALPLVVGSQLDGSLNNGYATWYVAAVGTLLTITATRKRPLLAWIGAGVLVVHTVLWAGPGALGSMGVIGSVVWVAAAALLSRALAKAARDAQQFSRAEREAARWQAAQEAHLDERQVRLRVTNRLALDMLHRIVQRGGMLDEEQRQECRYLEAAIRDEIRGRRLLNDAVREQVMLARRRGAIVTLLDEGAMDDVGGDELERVLNRLAAAIAGTSADKIIVRTAADGSDTAVTVVGLRNPNPTHAHFGEDDTDDEVDLWLEIPRSTAALHRP